MKPATSLVKDQRFSKTQIIAELALSTGLTKVQIRSVMDASEALIERHIRKRSVGEFVWQGMFKIKTRKKPAKKERMGINPFTGEETLFKAKPASTVVKVTALSRLKEMPQR